MRINLAKPDDRMGILEGNSVSLGFRPGAAGLPSGRSVLGPASVDVAPSA